MVGIRREAARSRGGLTKYRLSRRRRSSITMLRSSVFRSLGPARLSSNLRVHVLSPGFQTALCLFSDNLSGMSQQPPSLPTPPYQASRDLRDLEWPEENLTSTVDEGAGFYPVRLGETFDDGRFVITRKLGWGGYSTVWLARDRKCVAIAISSSLTNSLFESTETIAMLCSRSSLPTHQGKL